MPTYQYKCEINNEEFEAVHSIKKELQECEICREKGLEQHKPTRLISTTSFILAGSGWAKEGYSSR